MLLTDRALEIKELLQHHPRNMGIEYIHNEDEHRYIRHHESGRKEDYQGITSLLKEFAPFDAESIKKGIVYSKKEKYAHLNSVEDVEAEWQEARDYGDYVHDGLEQWGVTGEYPDISEVQQTIRFFEQNNLIPVAFEHVVFCDTLKRATPADIILFNPESGKLLVSDYKTSKEIRYKPHEYRGNVDMMEYPLNYIYTSNFYQYSLQTAFSRRWLQEYYFPDGQLEFEPYGYIFHIRDGVFTPHKTISMNLEVDKVYEWKGRIAS